MLLDKKLFLSFTVGTSMLVLPACQGALDGISKKATVPVPQSLVFKMKAMGMKLTSPIMMRIFKQENTLEVWKRKSNGRYALLTQFEICKWSGKYGPKFKTGDRQAPEGFYTVNKHQMNPNSQYHLSFNMGYPNAYDRAHGRTGAHLMVHGACSSAGCYSMTDKRVEVIYSLARDAFKGGQRSFQIQAYPFKMTAANMVKHRKSKHAKFWTMIKKGNDLFEITNQPPKVNVCERRYEFGTKSKLRYPSSGKCPPRSMSRSLATAYLSKQNKYLKEYERHLARAEGRAAKPIKPLSLASALPGVKVAGTAAEKPAIAKVEAAQKPVTVAPVVKKSAATVSGATVPPPAPSTIESKLSPAG